MTFTPTSEIIEAIKFIVATTAPFLSGWFGLRYGLKQIKEERRLTFIEKQLKEFYSPLLGIHKEISAKSEYRLKVGTISGRLWKENVQNKIEQSIDSVHSEIEYNNRQLKEEFLPLYREMLLIFRSGYWLAEQETKHFYSELVEYVEGWNRWENKGINTQTIQEIGHTEGKLKPFYKELEKRTEILRSELAQKN